eukprot:m.29509 g.29509  ORF g.29509 m.29509 type:complete len:89 (+) comp9172_c0_seq1:46-312(+)
MKRVVVDDVLCCHFGVCSSCLSATTSQCCVLFGAAAGCRSGLHTHTAMHTCTRVCDTFTHKHAHSHAHVPAFVTPLRTNTHTSWSSLS